MTTHEYPRADDAKQGEGYAHCSSRPGRGPLTTDQRVVVDQTDDSASGP